MVSSVGIVDLFPIIRKYKLTENWDEFFIDKALSLFNRTIHQEEDLFEPFKGFGAVSVVCQEIIQTLVSLGYWIPGKGSYQLMLVEEYRDDLPYLKNAILNHGKYQFKMESV